MRTPGDAVEFKWRFARSFMAAGFITAGVSFMLVPSFSSYAKQFKNLNPDLDLVFVACGIAALSAVVALAYGFIPRQAVGLAALAIYFAALVVFFMSKVAMCTTLFGLFFLGRGGWQLYKSRKAMAVSSSPPLPPLSPTP